MSLACTLNGPLNLSVEHHDTQNPGSGQVRVRLGAGGICGSDLHYYQHGRAGIFAIRAPFVPGHEASGVVDAVGDGVTKVKVGQKVAVNPAHPCGVCPACRAGRSNLCEKMVFLGSAAIFPHIHGFFREHFMMNEAQLTAIDEDVSLGEIACAEPLSVIAVRRLAVAAAGLGSVRRKLLPQLRQQPLIAVAPAGADLLRDGGEVAGGVGLRVRGEGGWRGLG